MNNNERLMRLKSALYINDEKMVEIFKCGYMDFSTEEINKMCLVAYENFTDEEKEAVLVCKNDVFEAFLNGFIILKRGETESDKGKPRPLMLGEKDIKNVNNVLLKKMKIALSLTNDDLIDIFKSVGIETNNRELSPIFRKEGHKHYKKCSDAFVLGFIDGIAKLKHTFE
ncbi:MAG: DUF1456 family protein [Acidaminobacteraceae bacterium]